MRPDRIWVKHTIDESWSQGHALTLVDLNGDGRKDLLTGKRFMAHDGHDPGEREPCARQRIGGRSASGVSPQSAKAASSIPIAFRLVWRRGGWPSRVPGLCEPAPGRPSAMRALVQYGLCRWKGRLYRHAGWSAKHAGNPRSGPATARAFGRGKRRFPGKVDVSQARRMAPDSSNVPSWLRNAILDSVRELGYEIHQSRGADSDHRTFMDAGIVATDIATNGLKIHSPEDLPDQIIPATLEKAARS
jgi:hypothetical protein